MTNTFGVSKWSLFAARGTPEHIRSDTGPEFVSRVICRWLKEADVKTLFIPKGSPWENGYVESFNGTLRDELLNREIFLILEEACWVIDRWRLEYSHHRIHSSLSCQTSAAYAADLVLPASAVPQPPEHSHNTNPNSLTQPGAKMGGSQASKISVQETYTTRDSHFGEHLTTLSLKKIGHA